MKIKPEIQTIQWDILTLKRKINSLIRQLPDNPEIQRLPGGSFTINSNTIFKHNNWSPLYYDFKYQYKQLIKKLKTVDPLTIHDVLTRAIENKSFTLGKETIQLHDTVIENIKNLIK